uniref:Doublecortin domain-containing protein n=1 Tax=Panagrellus redivivus TaxID=6233 RepID=A0A7E4V7M0_PANRE
MLLLLLWQVAAIVVVQPKPTFSDCFWLKTLGFHHLVPPATPKRLPPDVGVYHQMRSEKKSNQPHCWAIVFLINYFSMPLSPFMTETTPIIGSVEMFLLLLGQFVVTVIVQWKSSFSPSIYDPYNNISFVELNKQRRHEANRPTEDRVYNRVYKPRTAKLYIRRNGDLQGRPKPFIWRIWQSPKFDDLVEEIANHLDMNSTDATLYDPRGKVIHDSDEIFDGGTYVLAQREPFDGQRIEVANGNISNVSNYSYPLTNAKQRSFKQKSQQTRQKSRQPRPESYLSADNQTDIYSLDDDMDLRMPNVASAPTSDFGNYNMYRDDEYLSQANPNTSYNYEDTPWANLDELNEKEKNVLQKHREKHNFRRSRSAVIYNRRDQTIPDAYIIYTFLNGQGLECQFINFNRKQLEKGLNFILELVARKFSVTPAKLVNMDGVKIREVNELMSRGAYVLIPQGQSFRDTWYFLPDNAIDTSSDAERIRLRSAQRDRYLQKQEIKAARATGRSQNRTSRQPAYSQKTSRSVDPNRGY